MASVRLTAQPSGSRPATDLTTSLGWGVGGAGIWRGRPEEVRRDRSLVSGGVSGGAGAGAGGAGACLLSLPGRGLAGRRGPGWERKLALGCASWVGV